jgi:cytochrome bd ubiquinol oxidase subunit I
VITSLLAYIIVYAVIYAFGLYYIYRLLNDGLKDDSVGPGGARPGRPLADAIQTEAGNRE